MEGYIDLSTDEKLLAWWEENCPAAEDPSTTVGVAPVPGAGCQKCDLREMDQVFGGTTHGYVTFISKARAEGVVKRDRKAQHKIPNKLLDFLILQNEFDEQHVAHVSGVHTPGIIACGCLNAGGGNRALFCYLIDGTHRAVAARRAGRQYAAYVLSFKETFECTVSPKTASASAE